jgi:hypothetical protein
MEDVVCINDATHTDLEGCSCCGLIVCTECERAEEYQCDIIPVFCNAVVCKLHRSVCKGCSKVACNQCYQEYNTHIGHCEKCKGLICHTCNNSDDADVSWLCYECLREIQKVPPKAPRKGHGKRGAKQDTPKQGQKTTVGENAIKKVKRE